MVRKNAKKKIRQVEEWQDELVETQVRSELRNLYVNQEKQMWHWHMSIDSTPCPVLASSLRSPEDTFLHASQDSPH